MTVGDLISVLERLDPSSEVVIDMTRDGAEMFYFVSVDVVEKAILEDKEEVVVLSTEAPGIVLDRKINLN